MRAQQTFPLQSDFAPWEALDARGDAHKPHPCHVCESLALKSVRIPESKYRMQSDSPHVSSLQLETATHAMQSLIDNGFFALGDGTGVGKGRTIALIILEWLTLYPGASVLWVSANMRLRHEASREFDILGVDLSGYRYQFLSYSGLVSRDKQQRCPFADVITACDPLPLIVLDECHVLRNMQRTYSAVRSMMERVPGLRALYSSATMMSDAKHVRYLPLTASVNRGSCTAFTTDEEFEKALTLGGCGFLELFCMHMKSRGMYCARQLSCESVTLNTVALDPSVDHIRLYDAAVAQLAHRAGPETHLVLQRLLVSFKLPFAIPLAHQQLAMGKSVIFALHTTGAAMTQRTMAQGGVAPGSSVIETLPALDRTHTCPLNAVDAILDEFGATRVAEITGRRHRFVRASASEPWQVQRVPCGEADAFQSGRKRIAILSRAGGLGLSLNDTGTGQRHVIVLEFPWSCEDFAQQIGRAHRASNITPPEYTIVSTTLPCEQRILQPLLRRTLSMGALTKGDGKACDMVQLYDATQPATTTARRRAVALKILLHRAMAWSSDFSPMAAVIDAQAFHVRWGQRTRVAILNAMVVLTERCLDALPIPPAGAENALASMQPHVLRQTMCDMCYFAPSFLTPSVCRWSPGTHLKFGQPVHDWVCAVLMVHAHIDALTTLGCLSTELLHYVIELALWEGDDVALVSAHLRLRPSTLPTIRHEVFMNACAKMPVAAQCALMRLTDVTTPTWKDRLPDNRQCSLVDLMRDAAGSGVGVEIKSVSGDADQDYIVTLRYSVLPAPVVPTNAIYWVNLRSRQASVAAGLNAAHAVTFHGVCTAVHHHMVARSTAAEYAQQRARWEHTVNRRILTLRTSVRVATHNAMREWNLSRKKIVRIATPDGADVVGLLL
tara:strand:- start:327 stop:3014 length:2688 start_codon:yes stop_codon:yes gene_type:complete